MSLTITTSVEGSEHRVNVVGEVDVSCADELRQAIDDQLADAKGGELVVDLSEVPYIDSTGIGVLVGAAHRAVEASCKLVVARPQRNVSRVLGLLGVQADLNIREA